jgi:hypothetical protein
MYPVVMVGSDIVVEYALLQEFAAQVYGHFEIHVVTTPDNEVGRPGRTVAQVGVFAAADTQDRFFGSDIEVTFSVVKRPQPFDETSVSVDGDHLAVVRGCL